MKKLSSKVTNPRWGHPMIFVMSTIAGYIAYSVIDYEKCKIEHKKQMKLADELTSLQEELLREKN